MFLVSAGTIYSVLYYMYLVSLLISEQEPPMIISEFNYAGGPRASVLCLWCCISSTPHTLLLNHIIIEYQLVNILLVKTLSRWQRFDVLGLAKWRRLSDLSTAQKMAGNTRS